MQRAAASSAPPPPRRLVALGASNLARVALALLDAARADGPVEAHMALGRGRSFGLWSSLLGRRLPGIDGCGLWNALAAAPPARCTAIVTDVGNDVLYGVEVDRVLAWVGAALARLSATGARCVVAGLPLDSLRDLGNLRFVIVRSVLVPSCRLSLREVLARAERLDTGLRRLAAEHAAEFVTPRRAWYGADPVHAKRRLWPEVAASWLGNRGAPPPVPVDGSVARWRFLFARPAERVLFGSRQTREQPVRRWRDGTTLSLW